MKRADSARASQRVASIRVGILLAAMALAFFAGSIIAQYFAVPA